MLGPHGAATVWFDLPNELLSCAQMRCRVRGQSFPSLIPVPVRSAVEELLSGADSGAQTWQCLHALPSWSRQSEILDGTKQGGI